MNYLFRSFLLVLLLSAGFCSFGQNVKITNYTRANGLTSNYLTSIVIDTLGNIWGGAFQTIWQFDGTYWTKRDSPTSLCSPSCVDNNNGIWFVSGDELYKYKGETNTLYTTADGFPNNAICLASDIDNNIWIGTYGGVTKFNGQKWTTYTETDGLSDNSVSDIAQDIEGNMWFVTQSGISKYDGTTWTTFSSRGYQAGDSVISVAANGDIWFGGWTGATKYDGKNWKKYTTADGLISNHIFDIVADLDGTMWFATDIGLSKFDGITWVNYTVADGFSSNRLSSLAIDLDGNKWIGNSPGVSKLEDGGAGPYKPEKSFIKGTVYYDKNKNGQQDNGEYLIDNQYLQMQPTGAIIGNFDGKFSFYRKDGHYTLSLMPDKNWEATTGGSVEFDIKNGKTQTVLAFGIAPKAEIADFSADLIGRATRASFNTRYWLNATNIGTAEPSSRLTMEFSPLLTFQSASVEPTKITANTIEWDIAAINVFDRQQIAVDFTVANVNYLGDTIKNTVTISPDMADADMSNNSMTLAQVITGSYDPNDKHESTGVMSKGYTLFGQELDYTIRFQNTGTDTAFTVNITDTLHSLLDYTSFKLQSSSHACTFTLDEKGVVKFTFKNILLPDNKKNELASNGYVEFSIKPKAGMAENTEIKNTGYIYFDFNPAIVTNTALNTFVSVIPADADKDGYADRDDFAPNDPSKWEVGVTLKHANDQLVLTPNPAKNRLFVSGTKSGDYMVSNVDGQIIARGQMTDGQIDVSMLPAGNYILQIGSNTAQFIKE